MFFLNIVPIMKKSRYFCCAFNIEGNLKTNKMKKQLVRSFEVSHYDLRIMQKYFTTAAYSKFVAFFGVHYLRDGYHHLGKCPYYRCETVINPVTRKKIITISKFFIYAIYDAGLKKDAEGFRDYWFLKPIFECVVGLLK